MRHNLNPEIWGPHAWFFIESSVLSYPDNPSSSDKKKMSTFLKSLQYAIPCEGCRNHYKQNLKSFPLNENVLKNKDELFKWVVNLHNNANRRNTFSKNEDETLKYYVQVYSNENPKKDYIIQEKFDQNDNVPKYAQQANVQQVENETDQKIYKTKKSYYACFILVLIVVIFLFIYKKL